MSAQTAPPASPAGPARFPGPANGAPASYAAPAGRTLRSRQHKARRKFRKRLLFFLADSVAIHLGFYLAYYLRYVRRVSLDGPEFFDAPFSAYYLAEAVLLAVLLFGFTRRGLYRLKRTTQWLDEAGIIATGTTMGISILVMVFYIFRPGVTSRAMLFYALVSITVLLSAYRLVVRWVIGQRRRHGLGLSRVLVVGAGHVGKMVMQQMANRPGLGYVLAGFCDDVVPDFGRFRCLGAVSSLRSVLVEHRVDEVVIALPSAEHQRILHIVALCQEVGVEFRLVPDTFDLTLGTVEVDNLANIPLIGMRETALGGFNRALKRASDIVVASLALLVVAPIMVLVAIAVKLDSRGPVFLPQERVGLRGRVFRIYKVRSMFQDADQRLRDLMAQNEAQGPIFKMKNDPRRTRVGRIIRKLSLDEVPQFWNVLKGDMSLVGPRPPIPHEVEQYDDWHRRRLEVVPGLTGLWQVSGRSDLPFEEMVMLDLYYIENWSLGLDLKLILQTFPAVLTMRGAY